MRLLFIFNKYCYGFDTRNNIYRFVDLSILSILTIRKPILFILLYFIFQHS